MNRIVPSHHHHHHCPSHLIKTLTPIINKNTHPQTLSKLEFASTVNLIKSLASSREPQRYLFGKSSSCLGFAYLVAYDPNIYIRLETAVLCREIFHLKKKPIQPHNNSVKKLTTKTLMDVMFVPHNVSRISRGNGNGDSQWNHFHISGP